MTMVQPIEVFADASPCPCTDVPPEIAPPEIAPPRRDDEHLCGDGRVLKRSQILSYAAPLLLTRCEVAGRCLCIVGLLGFPCYLLLVALGDKA